MSIIPEIVEELKRFVNEIGQKSMFSGQRISQSLLDKLEIEERENGAGVLAPFWFPVLQKGRGPRKNTKDHQLWKKIFAWMQHRNMFQSVTEAGRVSEAKRMTWYINKYGNKHFRSGRFIDIYEAAREETIERIEKKYGEQIDKITKEIL